MTRIAIAGALLICALWAKESARADETTDEAALRDRFRQLDKNGDGRITTDEVPQSAFFKQRDQDGDGAITLAEAMEFLAAASATDDAPSQKPLRSPGRRGESPTASLRQGPQPLRPGDHGVGRRVENVAFRDLAGKSHQLGKLAKDRVVVVALTSTSCPLSKKYLPTLTKLADACAKRNIRFVLVNPRATDKIADMQTAAKSLPGNALYVADPDRQLARAVGAETTTDVIVIDSARTIVYHGAVDDQYGQAYALDAPRHRYLAAALDAIVAGQKPEVAATSAPGCTLDLAPGGIAQPALTYHNRISRIVQAHCVECHREGGVAPFSLATFAEVRDHAPMMKQVVEQGIMPPWFAAAHEAPTDQDKRQPRLWANDRSMSDADKADLLTWISGGRPEGEAADAPLPRSFASGWEIGTPDAVFEFPQAVQVKAAGTMPYESVLIDTRLGEDKWVQAIEIQPGERGVVHHMLVYVQVPGRKESSRMDDLLDEVGGFWGVYVPGNATLKYPSGFAKRLPKGCKLRCQVHYVPNGTATSDRSRIGVVYAKDPPRHEVHVVGLADLKISIPPGARNHREEVAIRLPADIEVLSLLPHMHARATSCRYRVIGEHDVARPLLDIPRYDYNWQLLYRFQDPQPVARGEAIKFTVWYDNSDQNPANPDPTATVRWGQQKTDEMHLGYVEYFIPGLKPGEELNLNPRHRAFQK